MQSALTALRHSLQTPQAGSNSKLAGAMMDSRNWLLSLVMSHTYIQWIMTPKEDDPRPTVKLFNTAAEEGILTANREMYPGIARIPSTISPRP